MAQREIDGWRRSFSCCLPTVGDDPYCPEHRATLFQPPKMSEADLIRMAKRLMKKG